MKVSQCFLVSYLFKNQIQSLEVSADADTLSPDDVRPYIEAIHSSDLTGKVSNIQVRGIHQAPIPKTRPHQFH